MGKKDNLKPLKKVHLNSNKTMKLNVFVFCVGFLVVACNTTVKERMENVVIAEKKVLEQTSCNILTLNVQSKYMISEVDVYFIWKKYGVLVDRKIEMTREDSCYYEAMKLIIGENKGEKVVNTIILETEELTRKPEIENL